MSSQSSSYRILVVDDEEDLCEILKFNLETEGYAVDVAHSAEEALTMRLASYDLLLLDVMMGGMSGFVLMRELRNDAATASLPVIFLTARDTENDVVTGFNLGADDYISKPFSLREVALRVKAVLRRSEERGRQAGDVLGYQGLVVNLDRKAVTLDGVAVTLTRIEFDLLVLMLGEPGHVFSRQALIDRVWPRDVLVLDRTVDVNITRLRKKLGDYAACIVTRQGFGYCFETR